MFRIRLLSRLWILAAACGAGDDDGASGAPPEALAAAPELTAIKPDHGKVGDAVTVTGKNLGDGTGAKLVFGAKPAAIDAWTDTKITATVPKGAGESVYVEVNGLKSNALEFALDTAGTPPVVPGGGTPPTPGPNVPYGTLTGTVFSSAGPTVPAARVVVAADANFTKDVRNLVAGADAKYGVSVPEGNYYVKASKDINGNGVYFQVGVDEIGWAGRFRVDANGNTVGDVNLDPVPYSSIGGRVVDADASWGSTVTGVVTWDIGSRAVRYNAVMNKGDFAVAEVTGATVGVVAYKDVNGNGRFDPNVEPAINVNAASTAPAAGLARTFPAKRTITGTIANAAGWTLVARDANNNDPSGSRWIVGTQVLDATGSFTITALASSYDLRVFRDLNGNGVRDGNEPQQTITGATINATAGNPAAVSLAVPPDVVYLKSRVVSDANANGRLDSGETAKLEVTVVNLFGKATNLVATASAAANVTVYGNSAVAATLDYGQSAAFLVDVTAATLAPGEQIEVQIDLAADGGYTNNFSVFAADVPAAPYTLSTVALAFNDISGLGGAQALGNAQNQQNSEFIDFRANQGWFTGAAFKFPFYGMWMTDAAAQAFGNQVNFGVEVGDNGYLNFLNAADRLPIALPSSDQDTQFVLAPQWANFIPGQVHALVQGTAPNRTLTIQWKNVSPETAPATDLSFQVILHETTGVIDVVYGAVAAVAGQQVGANYGDGSTWLTWTPSASSAVRLTPNF